MLFRMFNIVLDRLAKIARVFRKHFGCKRIIEYWQTSLDLTQVTGNPLFSANP